MSTDPTEWQEITMKWATAGEASVYIGSSPEHVYALVSDITRVGEWSPETYRCEWINGDSAPRVGARFRGYNRRGRARWSNTCEVVIAEPGHEFAFQRAAPGAGTVVWRYRVEPKTGGTRLTESYEVTRQLRAIGVWLIGLLQRVEDRDADLVEGMRTTLERLKRAAETHASNRRRSPNAR